MTCSENSSAISRNFPSRDKNNSLKALDEIYKIYTLCTLGLQSENQEKRFCTFGIQ